MTPYRRAGLMRVSVLLAAIVLSAGAARAAGPAANAQPQPQPALVVTVVTPTRADVADLSLIHI